jgi:hypothetical protein
MGLKLGSLRSMASASPDADVRDDDILLVLVKLARGASAPAYLKVRNNFGPELVSAEVAGRDLRRLRSDPAVVSVERSKEMPVIR